MSRQALLIFARNLRYGQVKTRLAATAGKDAAFEIYKQLLEHTANVAGKLPVRKMVFYSSHIDHQDAWDDNSFAKYVQRGDGLGERMYHALRDAFDQGYEQAASIGTDCLELSPEILSGAFSKLEQHDVVIGPAEDGGYYLIGMKQPVAALFKDISWSTPAVLAQTLRICEQQHLSYCLLQALSDVDDEEDWNNSRERAVSNQRGV